MELVDIGEIAAECDFGVFKNVIAAGGRVRGLNAKGAADKYSRKIIDELTAFVGDYGAKGLAFFRVKEGFARFPDCQVFSQRITIGQSSKNYPASRVICCFLWRIRGL